ncbi:MAG: ABC transporter substrate-binding protein [Fimbriimonadaceae bacterium]
MDTRVPFIVAALVVALAGCRAESVIVGGKPPEKRYTNVVGISPGATEAFTQVATSTNLKGRCAACDYPPHISQLPVVAEVKPNYEKITEIGPDLVVYDAELFSDADLAKFKELGIETFAFSATTIPDFQREMMLLGRLTGSETNASDRADEIQAEMNIAQGAPPAKTLRTMAVTGAPNSDYYVAGTKSFTAAVIQAAGGQAVGPDSAKYEPMTMEAILAANPEVIFVAGSEQDASVAATALMRDPRFQSVDAVKNGTVFGVDGSILLRRGSRVKDLIKGMYGALTRSAMRGAN